MLLAIDLERVVIAACRSPEDLALVRADHPDAPILAIVPDEAAEIALLQAGADDVIRVGVSEELAWARGLALASRSVPIRFGAGAVTVDLVARAAHCAGRSLPLREHEYVLLVSLLRRVGAAVDYATLRREVWGSDQETGSEVLASSVSRLRAVLAPEAMIVADKGRGYRLIAEHAHPA